MAKTVDQYFDDLRGTRVWRSVFRSGTGSSTLKRALAIQQNVFLHLFSTKVRTRMLSFSATWYLGTLTLGTFLILVATGIPLMLYYHPSVPQAYADTKDLQFVVSSGMFLRNLHRWSAHAMVFLVFAHMFKVFYRGAYRSPREFNWVIGVVLLLITLLLSYTGYLLPWDQLAYWAITVGSNIASAVPVIGEKIHFLLLGGNAVNANALLRFYVLHCMILPLTAMFFVAIHFWRIRKDGGLYSHDSEPAIVRAEASAHRNREGGAIAMADSKDFVAGVDSNAKKSPRRIVFITRRTSAQVKAETEDQLQTFPEVLFRAAVAIMTSGRRTGLDRADVQCSAGRSGRSLTHAESREGAVVLPRTAGDAALLSARGCGGSGAGAGGDGAHRHSVLQGQHRSRRIFPERPRATPAAFSISSPCALVALPRLVSRCTLRWCRR